MARDFDFKRKATSTARKVPLSKPAIQYSAQRGRGKWSLVLLVIGLIAIGVAIYYQFNQPNKVGTTGDNSANSLNKIDPSQIRVGVYTNGQDLTVCRDLANNISEQGYIANCVGQSLAEHVNTEIWAASEYKTEAEKINDTQGLKAEILILNTESQYQLVVYTGSS